MNIELIGPGWWMKMHRDACRATTEERKRVFEYNMEEDCNNFPCARCKVHFRAFLNNYPLKKYWNIRDNKGRDIGFFKWTWELHNQVNQRLQKREPTFEEAYTYYTESSVNACFNCGDTTQALTEFRSMPIPSILTTYLEKKHQEVTNAVYIVDNNRSIIKRLQK